jgi:hypothetical protein
MDCLFTTEKLPMATLPEPNHTTVAKIYQAYENDADDGNRPHLGASLIGHQCERYLWNTFRWVDKKKFEGRLLRLFETGQNEEARMAKNLRRIGIDLHTETPDGKQWRVSDIGGHFGGSLDGAGKGFPEAPKTWAVWECKTSNTKGFKELLAKGLQSAKPQHYAQVTCYMGYTGMDRAMYTCVCKETDEIFTEWVHFDPVEFAQLKARAERVIRAAEPPMKISNDPSWFVCKFCSFHEHCHGDTAPAVNCRTCSHSTPEMDGDARWSCAIQGHGALDVPTSIQRTGCSQHRIIPILLQNFATQKDFVNGDVVYSTPHGDFANGDGPGALTSQEIRDLANKTMLADVASMKAQVAGQGFDAKVVAE